MTAWEKEGGGAGPPGTKRLLTFRLDADKRQRVKARLARDGTTMSAVITGGLRQYVQQDQPSHADHTDAMAPSRPYGAARAASPGAAARPQLPPATAAGLRDLRSCGRSGVLSASLTALHEAGWPLPVLAAALGISRQAVQVRIRQRVPSDLRDRGIDYAPPPPFPRRRAAKGRKHLTIKIDHALRTAAHRAAAREGSSLSQVVERILERYLRDSAARRSR